MDLVVDRIGKIERAIRVCRDKIMGQKFSLEHSKLEEFTHAKKVTSHLSNDGYPAGFWHDGHPAREARSCGKPHPHFSSLWRWW